MKRFCRVCAFLTVLLILTGCTDLRASDPPALSESDRAESTESDSPVFSEPQGFIALSGSAFADEYPMYMDISGDTLLFLAGNDDGTQTTVRLWDLKENRLIMEKTLRSDSFISGAELDGDNVILYDEWLGKQYRYDTQLRLLSETEYHYEDPFQTILQNNPNLDDSYNLFDTYASKIFGDQYEAIIFYGSDDLTYFHRKPESMQQLSSLGHRILYCEEQPDALTFTLRDYDTMQIVNSASIDVEAAEDFTKIPYLCALNETYVCVPLTGDDGHLENVYFWNYSIGQVRRQFSAEVMDRETLDAACNRLIGEIESEFPITVTVNPDPSDFLESDYAFTATDNPVDVYLALETLLFTLRLYPEGIFADICDEMFDSYQICIVERFLDDEVAAYTSNMNGCVYIVLATDYFTVENIVHEIMHTMDYKLYEIDEKWFTLNPEGFSYADYGTENEPDYEEQEAYFARPYGMKDQLEDRAVTMECLFRAALTEQLPDCLNHSAVWKKAELLCSEIRNAYPSVQNADFIIWEYFLTAPQETSAAANP